eukprot:8879559-Lingulodinium_polyedra.AAC.1
MRSAGRNATPGLRHLEERVAVGQGPRGGRGRGARQWHDRARVRDAKSDLGPFEGSAEIAQCLTWRLLEGSR